METTKTPTEKQYPTKLAELYDAMNSKEKNEFLDYLYKRGVLYDTFVKHKNLKSRPPVLTLKAYADYLKVEDPATLIPNTEHV